MMFTKVWNWTDDFGKSGYGTLAAFAAATAIASSIALAFGL